ncbi:MAG: RluA family pseudouridine synthase [bacterium]|nr:RluA family pseudouridine synthase [bacterium]
MTTWTIDLTTSGERLDLFLTAQYPDDSRSALQKRIKSGEFLVNGKKAMVHRFLKEGDVVSRETRNIKHKTSAPIVGAIHELPVQPTVVAETADYLVIDKPIGLMVHPDSRTEEPTLVDWLMEHDPKIGKIGEDPSRPGIMHRLDREVSGLMVIAKTQDAFDSLKKQFATRLVEKKYIALVHGEINREEGDIKFRIARSSSKARMAARPEEEEEGRAAWTHYHILERFVGATLLELTILSGRTHQIRAHLHALGHAVMGDPLYTHKKTDRNVTAPRLMLQSYDLTFTDPSTNEKKNFHLEPDPSFAALVSEFRTS